MKNIDRKTLAVNLDSSLDSLKDVVALPGIESAQNKSVFVQQLIDSVRRVQFVTTISNRNLSDKCADPTSIAFDPIKGASYLFRNGNLDEAVWLTFIAIHFGKHKRSRWSLIKSVYGGLGENIWSWNSVTNDFDAFDAWLRDNYSSFQGSFGNHRKYESINPNSKRNPASVFRSYIDWIGPSLDHHQFFTNAALAANHNPNQTFDYLYQRLGNVLSFGRTAKFDFLTMIGKLGMFNLEPGHAFLKEATGPKKGANLLFGGQANSKIPITILNQKVALLHEAIQVGTMSMQVIEDALCNWQKSPATYSHFRG